MGEVKDTVKGSGGTKAKKEKSGGNLVTRIESLRNDVSDLIILKDEDTLKEGENIKSENVRKAALLRASHSLLTAIKILLEDY